MTQYERSAMLTGPGIMLLSAAIFGYFGFSTTFLHHSAITGKLLIYVPILDYTLKGCAVGFLLSGLITFVKPLPGNLLFSLLGLLSALSFLLVAFLDFSDKQHQVMSPLLLLIFAAWNGIGSWQGLKASLTLMQGPREGGEPPYPG